MSNSNITGLSTELPEVPDSPEPPERPEPPQVGELHTPDELRTLHRQLLDQAATLPARKSGTYLGRSDLEHWTTAATKVDLLWEIWRRRTHATEAHEPMRESANKAVHALIEALHGHDWRDVNSKFDLAAGWIDDVKMQADTGAHRRSFAPPPRLPARPKRRGLRRFLRGFLFGQPC